MVIINIWLITEVVINYYTTFKKLNALLYNYQEIIHACQKNYSLPGLRFAGT
jgi:flavoprotein